MQLPVKSRTQISSPYNSLGLKDLPFPNTPVVDPYSVDPRVNGTIYAKSPVQAQIEKFERLLIQPNDFPNRARLAYLWSKGDQQSGRGMGKTALLRYFQQRINRDWGISEFQDQFSALVVYVAFPSQIDRRYMEQLSMAALVDICKNRPLLDTCRVVLRISKLPEETVNQIIAQEDGSQDPASILDDVILQKYNIQPQKLDKSVEDYLISEGLSPAVGSALAQGRFENYLRSLRKDGNLEPYYVPRDTAILERTRTLLFNDMVLYLRAANFAGGYLFIDDIENLVDQMTRKDRIEFAKEFGLCTVRPGYANTTHGFFSCVLTTHQQASISLSQAWGEAGLSAIARLDPTSPNSVELPLPSKDQAREILVAHLDYYRVNEGDKGKIVPFTEDGLNLLLKKLHPRVLLSDAAKVLQYAVQNTLTSINEKVVSDATDNTSSAIATDFSEGIEDAL